MRKLQPKTVAFGTAISIAFAGIAIGLTVAEPIGWVCMGVEFLLAASLVTVAVVSSAAGKTAE